MITRNYFNICFESNAQYRIVETIKKPAKKNCAFLTLKKIEQAILHRFQMMEGWENDYSKKTPEQMRNILKTKSQEITNRYCDKIKKSNWLFRAIFGRVLMRKALDLNQRIQTLT